MVFFTCIFKKETVIRYYITFINVFLMYPIINNINNSYCAKNHIPLVFYEEIVEGGKEVLERSVIQVFIL